MSKINFKINSVRNKLFITLAMTVLLIMSFLILVNNFILETFYIYSKRNTLIEVYKTVNSFYQEDRVGELSNELTKVAKNNDLDIVLKTNMGIEIYTREKENFVLDELNKIVQENINNKANMLLYKNKNISIKKLGGENESLNYILLTGKLDNGYELYIMMPIASIKENVRILNNFLYLMVIAAILISAILIIYITKRFTDPILELKEIAQKMSKLDFSQKYEPTGKEDEIDNLGKSINSMSQKLEMTIKQLRDNNIELENDIEEKSKLNEMKTQFISDVSHELKTPIALIQGYAEGLVENVNSDEESRKFYANVILDETNKMDRLVKQLLELSKLEYGKREFNNEKFNIAELVNEVIRKSKVMIDEKGIEVKVDIQNDFFVYADEFYIEQIVTNYLTNAIKNVKSVNNEKYIKIKIFENNNKIRISVFNTGDNIDKENINRIWNRFYKIDTSRNRDDGGSGIGLSIVKAIMNNYNNLYGVNNLDNGIEFFFELDKGE